MEKLSNHSWSFHNLLIWLLLYILVSPIFASLPSTDILVSVLMTAVLFSAMYAVNRKSRLFTPAIILMGLTLILFWINVFNLVSFSKPASTLIICIYFGLLSYSMARFIFSARDITPSLISAALCLYLIFGMFWGSLYSLLEHLQPGSFAGGLLTDPGGHVDSLHYFQYFSFVTLTTLGYGDILPQTEIATSFCQVEAIIGQFFMAVLIARFVGIQVAQEFGAQK